MSVQTNGTSALTSKAVDYTLATRDEALKQASKAKEYALLRRQQAVTLVKNPDFQTVTITTGTGAIVLGSVGGAFGTAAGVVVGTTAGALPALFTFGLSLPIGATIGGGVGACAGATVGGTTGAVCGGLAGYRYKVQIQDGVITVRQFSVDTLEKAQVKFVSVTKDATEKVATVRLSAVKYPRQQKDKIVKSLTDAWTVTKATARTQRAKITAASVAGGIAVGAPVGGAVGTCTGIVAGGAVGLVPALFTFGLSIPFCAVVGGGIGLCAGTVTGGSVGAVGAGSTAFVGYTYRKEIGGKKDQVQTFLSTSAKSIQDKATQYAKNGQESLKSVFSGTGGTEEGNKKEKAS